MIIDTHVHLGSISKFWFYDVSVKKLLYVMDSLNIKFAINAHSESLMHQRYVKGAKESLSAFEQSNGRIFSYHIYNPRHSNECIEVIDKYHRNDVFKGIKIHPSFHETAAYHLSYQPIWEYAWQQNMPIMSHTWGISQYNAAQRFSLPENFIEYIKKYPDVKFICAHAGGRGQSIKKAAGMAAEYDNVYLDIAGDVFNYGLIEFLVNKCSSKKIMFGSDALWFSPAAQIGMILSGDFNNQQLEDIFFKNACNVFDIDDGGAKL